MFSNSPL